MDSIERKLIYISGKFFNDSKITFLKLKLLVDRLRQSINQPIEIE